MTSEKIKFGVACRVSNVGLNIFIEAWNHHSVPKKGKPMALIELNNKTVPIQPLLTKEEAPDHCEIINRRSLTEKGMFESDPLELYPDLARKRETEIRRKYNFEMIFSEIQQQNTKPLILCI